MRKSRHNTKYLTHSSNVMQPDSLSLKVVTLNIWFVSKVFVIEIFKEFNYKNKQIFSRGIKYFSKDTSFRVKHLIEALNQRDYDIIGLQEVYL